MVPRAVFTLLKNFGIISIIEKLNSYWGLYYKTFTAVIYSIS